MKCCDRYSNVAYVVLALAVAACGEQGITIIEPGPPSLAIAGVVTSQTGTPLAGAMVHSYAYKPDCVTPVHVERDTLLVASANGAFHGLLRALDTGAVCLRVFSTLESNAGAAQLVQAEFVTPSVGSEAVDTAVVNLTIP
jgi:hypothetical protein